MKKTCFIFCTFYCKPSWIEAGDTNVTLMSFLRLLTETITPERKVFFQNYMANVVKIDEIREEELSTSHFVM